MASLEQYDALQLLMKSNVDVMPVWTCERKRRYPDFASAFTQACMLAPKKGQYKMKVYPCEHCSGFHLACGGERPPVRLSKGKKSALQVMQDTCDAQIKEVMRLRNVMLEERREAAQVRAALEALEASDCECWWCRLRQQFKKMVREFENA